MTAERRFRWVAYGEGASFLALLAIGVPLKYWLGQPLAVRLLGPLHGGLFLLYGWLVFEAVGAGRFTARRAAVAMLAALLPFGPFWFEHGRPPPER